MVAFQLAADPDLATTRPGDRLRAVDGTLGPELMPGQTVHTVPAWGHIVLVGQTLWSLSRLYGVTVADLEQWNPGIVPTAIPIGTLLRVVKPVV